jgi:hypothetical protein
MDLAFLGGACARSTAITTHGDAAYKYGANIHD